MMKVKLNMNFAGAEKVTLNDLAMALYASGEAVMTDSKENYVPVVDGTLRGSGFVEEPKLKGSTLSVTLGYGGAASEYAVVVHEAPPTYGQGKNKYLTTPLYMSAPDIPRWMATLMAAAASQRRP
jgi:hypothetical protein